jgi:ribosomal protein S18 acetylase RimI-like enzyme
MSLGVKRPWRGRGLASALLAASFNVFQEAGMTHSMLAVDSENPTGALRLYQKMGYEVIRGSITSELDVSHPTLRR